MDEPTPTGGRELSSRIARLVQERGWNAEHFSRISGLNRHTVRQILNQDYSRRLRNTTVSACARALGLTVHELRDEPMANLLPRMGAVSSPASDVLFRLYEEACQPELLAWIEQNPQQVAALTPAELDELLSLQGTGGPLTAFGLQHFVERMERRRRLVAQVQTVANTEYLELLEQLVGLLYEKVQPFRANQISHG